MTRYFSCQIKIYFPSNVYGIVLGGFTLLLLLSRVESTASFMPTYRKTLGAFVRVFEYLLSVFRYTEYVCWTEPCSLVGKLDVFTMYSFISRWGDVGRDFARFARSLDSLVSLARIHFPFACSISLWLFSICDR